MLFYTTGKGSVFLAGGGILLPGGKHLYHGLHGWWRRGETTPDSIGVY